MEVAAVRGRGGSEEACVFCVVGGCKERRSQQQRRSEEKKRKSRPEKKNGKRSGGLNLWPAALKASRAGSVLLSLEHVECVAFGPSRPKVGEIQGPRKARRDSHSKKKETSPHLCCPKASKAAATAAATFGESIAPALFPLLTVACPPPSAAPCRLARHVDSSDAETDLVSLGRGEREKEKD